MDELSKMKRLQEIVKNGINEEYSMPMPKYFVPQSFRTKLKTAIDEHISDLERRIEEI